MEEETAGTGEFSTNISDSIGLVKAYLRVCEEEGRTGILGRLRITVCGVGPMTMP